MRIVTHILILCLLQVGVSSCYISKRALNQWHYSANNLKNVNTLERFHLVALRSVHHDNWPVKIQQGSVCLAVSGLDTRFWAVKDEFPWRTKPLADESAWNILDLTKSNWEDKRTVLKNGDYRISQYENTISQKPLSYSDAVMVLDLKQIYENIENCRGVVIIGKKRCYYFHNRFNYRLFSSGPLYEAFFHKSVPFPHQILAESNELRDIEEAAKRYADQHRSTVEQKTDMDDKL